MKKMGNFFKNYKGWWNLFSSGLLALIFANKVKAQGAPEYGIQPVTLYGVQPINIITPLYGITPPTPGEVLSRFIPFIFGVFLVFVIAPIIGLIWYRKRGGKKRWPSVVVWVIATLFVLVLIAFIILVYLYL